MKTNDSSLENLKKYACAMVPFWGAFYMHSEGVKEGYEKASVAYQTKITEWKNIVKQIKQDVFGEREIFIYPAGWDEDYWMKLCEEFFSQNTTRSSGKEILTDFLAFCIRKYTPDKDRLQETITQLTQIKDVIEMSPANRLRLEKGTLELTIHFLDAFGHPRDLYNYYANKGNEMPEAMKQIINEMIQLRDQIKAALDTSKGCNFLVLGKTGTGKSSLLNYLIGEKHFESGVGRPVTKKGIFPFSTMIDILRVNVYDSWGLEAGDHYSDWFDMLDKEKQKHDLRQSVSEWFHAVIYCIAGARFEDVDRDIVNSFVQDKYHVVVVFTKADLYSEDDEAEMRKTILCECPGLPADAIISVCSTDKVIRGIHHTPFGRDELKEAIFSGYKNTIINQLPKRIMYRETILVDDFVQRIKREIKNKTFGKSEENSKWLECEIKGFQENFNKVDCPNIFREEMRECMTVSKNLAQIIEYNDPIFHPRSPTNYIDDDDEWYEIVGKIVFATLVIVPAIFALLWHLLSGEATREEQQRLCSAVDDFQTKVNEIIKAQEPSLKQKIIDLLTPKK